MDQVPTFPVAAPCCDPAAQQVYFPSTALCVTTDCSGPFECNHLGTCVGGSCCAPTGSSCAIEGGGGSFAIVPCCDPAAVCTTFGFNQNACCFPNGGGCTQNFECCSGNCAAGSCGP